MSYFENMLLTYLWDGELEMKISGFDMEGFQRTVREEQKHRLEMIQELVFEDDDIMSDAEKVKGIRRLFQNDFYYKE